MSRHGEIAFLWGDEDGPGENGEYMFRIGIAEWEKLDERFEVGPFELLRRVSTGTWKVKYPREIIRLGLLAGGSIKTASGAPDDARVNRLVREYVDNRPLLQSVATAARILEAALYGPVEDLIPKSQAEASAAPIFQTEGSPSPASTDGVQASGTRRKRSEGSRSGSSTPAKPASASRKADRKSSSPQPQMSSTR